MLSATKNKKHKVAEF